MNKFKKVLLGALSVLTLGLFVVTGTKVNAATQSEKTINAYDLYQSGDLVGYNTKTKITTKATYDILTISETGNYVQKLYDAENSQAYLSKGNSTYEIDSDSYGFSFGKSGSITFGLESNQTATLVITIYSRSNKSLKTASSGGKNLVTFADDADVSSNPSYSISYKTSSSTSTKLAKDTLYDITITDLDSTHNLIYFDGAYGIGFAKMELTIETAGETHAINYYDINGNLCKTDNYEDGQSITIPSVPTVIGKTNGTWKLGSTSGETFTQTTMGDSDLNVYAVYDDVSSYSVANANKLDPTIIQFAQENYANAFASDSLISGTIYEVQTGTQFKKSASNTNVAGRSFTYYLDTTGKTTATEKGLVISAPSAGYITAYIKNGSSSGSKKVNLYHTDSLTTYCDDVTLDGNETIRLVFNVPAAGKYRLGGVDAKIYIYEVEFATSAVTTPVLEQQENATGSAIRYIATIETTNIDLITSWKATFTLEGKKAPFVTDSYTVLYTAVTGENGKDAATNTYYLVATLKNIPASFNGNKLTCKFTITLSDNTVVDSNTLDYTVAVVTA